MNRRLTGYAARAAFSTSCAGETATSGAAKAGGHWALPVLRPTTPHWRGRGWWRLRLAGSRLDREVGRTQATRSRRNRQSVPCRRCGTSSSRRVCSWWSSVPPAPSLLDLAEAVQGCECGVTAVAPSTPKATPHESDDADPGEHEDCSDDERRGHPRTRFSRPQGRGTTRRYEDEPPSRPSGGGPFRSRQGLSAATEPQTSDERQPFCFRNGSPSTCRPSCVYKVARSNGRRSTSPEWWLAGPAQWSRHVENPPSTPP